MTVQVRVYCFTSCLLPCVAISIWIRHGGELLGVKAKILLAFFFSVASRVHCRILLEVINSTIFLS